VPRTEAPLRLVEDGETPVLLEDIYRGYCRYVGAVVLRLGGRRAEVDDLVQDVFVEAARGLRGLRAPAAVKGWLATIAVRLVRRRLQVRRVWRLFGLDAEVDYAGLVDPAASPHDKLLVRTVYRVLDEVPVADRLAFTLHHVEGERLEKVARLCGCSLATAKRRIARAQQALQDRMGHD
jgi:RNA polymerase sigma-70 factor (ECF subfamily)